MIQARAGHLGFIYRLVKFAPQPPDACHGCLGRTGRLGEPVIKTIEAAAGAPRVFTHAPEVALQGVQLFFDNPEFADQAAAVCLKPYAEI